VSDSYLVGWPPDTDVASHALEIGDTAPGFPPARRDHLHFSEQLRANGPLVLSFFQGGWCPLRTAELCALQVAMEEFESAGATLAVVTPIHWLGGAARLWRF
jgi:peroxiredoxin